MRFLTAAAAAVTLALAAGTAAAPAAQAASPPDPNTVPLVFTGWHDDSQEPPQL